MLVGKLPRRSLRYLALLPILLVASLAAAHFHHRHRLATAFPTALDALKRDDQQAVLACIRALEGRPGRESELHLLRGAVFMRHSSWHSALAEFSQLEPKGEVRHPALRMTGECLYRVGQIGKAISLMQQLASEDPDNVQAHRWLGTMYYDLGANEHAIVELTRVTELDPNDYGPHRIIAMMQMDFEEYSSAIEHYRKALDLNPPSSVREELLLHTGKCLILERQYRGAIEVLQQAAPTALALARLSECHWSLGELEEAHRLLKAALAADPSDAAVLFLQARLELDAGKPEVAVRALQQIIAQDPVDREARYQLALAYQRLGDEQRQQAEMARWRELEAVYQRLSDLSQEAIENPSNAALRDQLADTCAALGKHELAAMWRRVAQALRTGQAVVNNPSGTIGKAGADPQAIPPSR